MNDIALAVFVAVAANQQGVRLRPGVLPALRAGELRLAGPLALRLLGFLGRLPMQLKAGRLQLRVGTGVGASGDDVMRDRTTLIASLNRHRSHRYGWYMVTSVSASNHIQFVTPAATASSKPSQSETSASLPRDSVQLSSAAQAALKEAAETPAQTAKEAASGDHQAQRLLATFRRKIPDVSSLLPRGIRSGVC